MFKFFLIFIVNLSGRVMRLMDLIRIKLDIFKNLFEEFCLFLVLVEVLVVLFVVF